MIKSEHDEEHNVSGNEEHELGMRRRHSVLFPKFRFDSIDLIVGTGLFDCMLEEVVEQTIQDGSNAEGHGVHVSLGGEKGQKHDHYHKRAQTEGCKSLAKVVSCRVLDVREGERLPLFMWKGVRLDHFSHNEAPEITTYH